MISGNKGEWSEFYAFLKLLCDNKLYAADENLEKLENGIKIVYDDTVITLIESIVIIENKKTKMQIEQAKKNSIQYKTPYGTIEMVTEGKTLELVEEPFLVKLSYQVKIGNAKEYVNELQIVVAEE